jgi:hypothetical protein
MTLTSDQEIRANEALVKIKEAIKDLTDALGGEPEGQ